MPLRVLLADDHLVVRQGLKALVDRAGIAVVAEASNGRDAIRLAGQHRPDAAVLDLGMPLLNGLDAAREILHVSPRTGAVALTMHSEDPYVLRALQVGMRGYVLKTQAAADLVQAIEQVARGGLYVSPGVAGALVQGYLGRARASEVDSLTHREREVLQLVAEGKTTKEIAAVLGLSAKTIESHRGRLMNKLRIHDVAGLARYAVRVGLVEP